MSISPNIRDSSQLNMRLDNKLTFAKNQSQDEGDNALTKAFLNDPVLDIVEMLLDKGINVNDVRVRRVYK